MLVSTEPGAIAVLIGVDADREFSGLLRRLDDAEAGAAGHLIDDVGAGVEHRLGHLQADRRIAEIVGIGDLHLGLRIDGARALDIADDELVDADRLRAADHADHRLAAHALDRRILGDERRERAGEIGAFLLLEQHRGDVGARLHLIEDHIVRAGIVLGDGRERVAVRIFEIDDEAEAGVRGAAQDVGGLRDDVLGFDGLAVQLGLGERLLETGIGEVVIGLIAETALRDDQRDRLFSRRAVAIAPRPKARAEIMPNIRIRRIVVLSVASAMGAGAGRAAVAAYFRLIGVAARVVDGVHDVEHASIGREGLPAHRHDDAARRPSSQQPRLFRRRGAGAQRLDAARDDQARLVEQPIEREPRGSRRLRRSGRSRSATAGRDHRAMDRGRHAVDQPQTVERDQRLFLVVRAGLAPLRGPEGEQPMRARRLRRNRLGEAQEIGRARASASARRRNCRAPGGG